MLGDGIVSFGVARWSRTPAGTRSASAKIGFSSVTLPSTCIAAGVHSMSPSALWNLTFSFPGVFLIAAEPVDEVHVPGRAAELAVGGRAQADVLLQLDRVADRVVLDRAQLFGVDRVVREVLARLQQRGRAEQAADVVGSVRRAGSV